MAFAFLKLLGLQARSVDMLRCCFVLALMHSPSLPARSMVGMMERYQHVYVWRRQYESGGRLWEQVRGRVCDHWHSLVVESMTSMQASRRMPASAGHAQHACCDLL